MSVSDGQNVDAAITNAGFMDKNEDTFTVGEVALQNPVPANGANIDSVQKELNSEASYTGKSTNTAENDLPAWVDSTVGTPTDNLRERSDALTTASTANTSDIADIRTTTGTVDGDVNMGVYSGTLLNDNESAKQNIQQLETATEANTAASAANTSDVADIRLTTGTSDGDTNMGVYSGSIISDAESTKQNIQQLETAIESLVTGLSYQGAWNADTNTPALSSGVGSTGFYYVVSVAGTTNLDGISDWGVGDWAIFADTGVWQKVDNSDQIGANQDLSNLTSPTAVNQHLIPNLTNARDLGQTGTLGWRDVFASGIAYINGGLTAASNGITKLFSQDQTGINTGDIEIFTGNATAGESGDITLKIGSASGGAPSSELLNTTSSSGGHFNGNITTFEYGATFTTSGGFSLDSIDLSLRTTAAATGNAEMQVWGVTGGGAPDPGNVIAISTNTLDLSTLTTSYSGETWNFSGETLLAATQYAYVVKDDGAATTGNLAFENGNAIGGESYYYNNPPWLTGGGLDGVYQIFSAAAAIKGDIFLKNGSEGTVGDVWTSKGTLGEGEWALPTGGGGSGVGGINYLVDDSFNFEGGTLGDWVQYYDGAVAVPIDGSGGAPPAQNFVINALSLIRGVFCGEVQTSGDSQGSGISVDFAIDPADKSSSLYVNFDYSFFASGATTINDFAVYAYNIDTPTMAKVTGNFVSGRFTGVFYTTATDTNYRFIIHHAGAETDDTQLNIDNIQIGPDKLIDFSSDGPIGQLMDFPINLVPDKFLYCDGTPISRTIYSDLFSVIGTQFGVGDGSTTFNLPDYRNAFFRGDSGGRLAGTTEADATAPNGLAINGGGHEHTRNFNQANSNPGNNPVGFLNVGAAFTQSTTGGGAHSHGLTGDAETRPANTAVKRCIRYAKGVSGVLSTTETFNETSLVESNELLAPTGTLSAAYNKVLFTPGDILSNDFAIFDPTTDQFTITKTGRYSLPARLEIQGTGGTGKFSLVRIYNVTSGLVVDSGGDNASNTVVYQTLPTSSGKIFKANKGDVIEIQSYTTLTTPTYTVNLLGSAFSLVSHPNLSVYGIYGETEIEEAFAGDVPYVNTTAWTELTSLTLGVGEWDISGFSTFRQTPGATAAVISAIGLGTAPGTSTAGIITGDTMARGKISAGGGLGITDYIGLPPITRTLTAETTFYLKTKIDSSAANLTVDYKLHARKVK